MSNKFIRNKLSIFSIVVTFIIGFNYLSFNYFIKSFILLEKQENKKILTSFITYIDSKFETINITTSDYGQWDDTYEFIKDKNQEYIYQNFRDKTATLENIKLNFMIFANIANENIYTQITNDLKIDNENDFSKFIINSLKENEKYSIVKYKNDYFYLVKSEILKSDSSGDLRGYIFSGKKFTLDDFPLDNENKILFIDNIDKSNITLDMTFKSNFIDDINVNFNYNKEILSNTIFFKNYNKDLLTLQFDNNRQIYKPGKKQIVLFNTSVSIFIIILFFVFYFYVNIHKKLNEELKIKVEEEVKKQKAQEEMLIHQSRLAEIGEMINNIAHQWRQPLNNLSLTIQNIGFTYENGILTQENLDDSINKSKKIINSMSNTIDTFRDFFEPNKNKNLFKIESSINNTIEILSSTLRFHNIKLTKEIIDDIETYNYENEFCQVLLNIITNAKDALVSEKIEDPKINIKLYKMQDKLIVEIKDNAKGINKNIINKIFEPYFTTKEKGEGTGVGLYMSKLIIEKNMNGKLTVKNDNDGAVFIITLNITKQEI